MKRTVDGYTFTIVYDGNRVIINGFPVTEDDWNTVIKGTPVTLTSPNGDTGKLTYEKSKVKLDGHPFVGQSVSVETEFPSEPITSTNPNGNNPERNNPNGNNPNGNNPNGNKPNGNNPNGNKPNGNNPDDEYPNEDNPSKNNPYPKNPRGPGKNSYHNKCMKMRNCNYL